MILKVSGAELLTFKLYEWIPLGIDCEIVPTEMDICNFLSFWC